MTNLKPSDPDNPDNFYEACERLVKAVYGKSIDEIGEHSEFARMLLKRAYASDHSPREAVEQLLAAFADRSEMRQKAAR